MSTIFTKIIKREIPAFIVAEDEKHIAFLDIAPIRQGHTLVICKEEISYFFDMPEEKVTPFMTFTKQVARAIELAVPCKRVGIGVLGFDVPHVHIHLLPLQQASDFDFAGPKVTWTQENMQKIAENIAKAFKDASI